MNLTINDVLTNPIDNLVELYRQGYQLDTTQNTNTNTLCSKCNKMKNMATVDMSGTEALVGIVLSVAIGSLIYYKVGKWEAKKLNWD